MPAGIDRRETIVRSAAALFAERGVAKTTVRDIADAVGILSGSLYHHFSSKDVLVTEIVTSYLDDLVASYGSVLDETHDPRSRLRGLVVASLTTMDAHPHAAEIYQNDGAYLRRLDAFSHLKGAAAKVQRTWINTVNAGVAAGVLRDDIPADIFYRLIRDAVWLSVRWYRPTPKYPIGQLAEDCTSIFLEGFAVRPRRSRV